MAETTLPPRAADARAERVVWAVLLAALAAIVAVSVWRLASDSGRGAPLPVYGTVPAFSLVERSGAPLSAADLRGRVWVANFVFTRCRGMCPGLSTTMAALLARLAARGVHDVTAVSFSVDPTRDDPATLSRYAQRFAADPERWLFLTGPRAEVERVVRDGFRLSIVELPPGEREASPEPITHSDRFVLVDTQLQIRGYYHGTDPQGAADLERDLTSLAPRP
jgi:cytochrome oxidase Cu insertion factor (SCO1/SenC/PrrC family)